MAMLAKQEDLAWKALPHDPMRQLSDNLWWVEGDLPSMKLRRAMTVARLPSGDLVIHNAIALSEAGMAALEALGRPAWLLVPNGWHRIDAPRFKARYPHLRVACPAGSRKRVAKKVAVDASYDEVGTLEDTVTLSSFGPEDTKRVEGVMLVRSRDGQTAVYCDALFNIPHLPGFFWWFYGRVLGAAGGPRITPTGRLIVVNGGARRALKAQLNALADGGVVRLIPGHGAPVEIDAPAAARALAKSL